MKLLIICLIITAVSGCALIKLNPSLSKTIDFNTAEDSLRNEIISMSNIVDSLYMLLDELNFTIDSLSLSLETANNRITVNPDFQLPDSIIFAGRVFNFKNERIYDKFEKIYQAELKSAYKFIPRSGKYFAIFDSIFSSHKIPLDAKYLAIAESRLSPLAKSRVGAVGIWQFMKSTAQGFGLKVNSFIDERRDVFKSTETAARFLQSNYNYLANRGAADWLLAMSAYNAGAGNISKAMKEQGGNDFFDLIMKSDESHNFVWRAVATKLIFQNEEEIFGKQFEREKPLCEQTRKEKLKLKGYYKIDDWAIANGTVVNKVWEYNPWIKIYKRSRKKYSPVNDVVLPSGEYTILLPKDSIKNETAVASIEKRFLEENDGYFTHHIVKKGDTLYDIAKKYHTTVSKIKALNSLSSSIIYPGQKLRLFGNISGSKNNYYVVKTGDSVAKIAKRLGISSNHIIVKNNLKSKNGIVIINPGQKLYY